MKYIESELLTDSVKNTTIGRFKRKGHFSCTFYVYLLLGLYSYYIYYYKVSRTQLLASD